MVSTRRSFNGLVVAVTGAGGASGKAVATALADRGARLALGDLDYKRAARLASAINHTITPEGGGIAIALGLDMRDPVSIRRFLEETRGDFGSVDVLIHQAPTGFGAAVEIAVSEMAQRTDGHVLAVGVDRGPEQVSEQVRRAREEFAGTAVAFTAVVARSEPPVAPDQIAAAVIAAVRGRPEEVRVPRRMNPLRRRFHSALPVN